MSDGQIIIVGGGTAGCVAAYHLANQGSDVTIVEHPHGKTLSQNHRRPANWLRLLGGTDDYDFTTQAVDELAGRSIVWPRGRGLGGSSRINAMIWFPPTDHDIETLSSVIDDFSAAELRGFYSLTKSLVQPEPPRWLSESSQRFLQSAASCGYSPMTYDRINREGVRWTPAELLKGTNVKVVQGIVDRIGFDNDRATTVCLDDGQVMKASERIILSAGAIGTPAILMRSGIGPPDLLSAIGIDVRHACTQIGANLQDHLVMPVVFRVQDEGRFLATPTTQDVTAWQSTGQGPIASNIAECGGLFDDNKIQIHTTPTHWLKYPKVDRAAMTIAVSVTLPESRGRLVVISPESHVAPVISPAYLQSPSDLQQTIDAVRIARKIASTGPLADWCTQELLPGSKRESDESIARSIRHYAQTLFHCLGTCAMGSSDRSPVDKNAFVRGAENLQVIDASILPQSTAGNPSSIVMTLATALTHQS